MNVIVGDVFLGVVWDILSHCGMVLCEVTDRRKYEKGWFLLCVAKYINLLTFIQSSTPVVYLLLSLLFLHPTF